MILLFFQIKNLIVLGKAKDSKSTDNKDIRAISSFSSPTFESLKGYETFKSALLKRTACQVSFFSNANTSSSKLF